MTNDDLEPLFRLVVAGYADGQHRAKDEERCPDQYVGLVDKAGYQFGPLTSDFAWRQPPSEMPTDTLPIVMLLESPHSREFPKKKSVGPARGTTGSFIRKHLAQAFERLLLFNGVYRPLILMNVIQHQCSLGQRPKLHRDAVFSLMWDQPAVRTDFIRRLRDYARDEGALVINACTSGGFEVEGDKLWRRIESTIGETLDRPSDLSVPHPSSWIGNHVIITPRSVRMNLSMLTRDEFLCAGRQEMVDALAHSFDLAESSLASMVGALIRSLGQGYLIHKLESGATGDIVLLHNDIPVGMYWGELLAIKPEHQRKSLSTPMILAAVRNRTVPESRKVSPAGLKALEIAWEVANCIRQNPWP